MNYRPLNHLFDPDVPPRDDHVISQDGTAAQGPGSGDVENSQEAGVRPWVLPLAVGLLVVAVGLTGWNLARLMQDPPAPPAPTAVEMKRALYLGVLRIEAYRKMHGVIPTTVAEVGLANGSGYVYDRVDPARYVLSFESRGARQEYDSTVPVAAFFGTAREMLSLPVPRGSE